MHSAWNETLALEIVRRYDGREGPLLPILHDVQATFGCVPVEAIRLIATELNLTRAEVHGVASFYHDFRDRPAGRHVLKVCRAEACQSMQGEAVAEQVLKHFGVGWGETTSDGALTIEATYCLGLCACAPSAMLDNTPMARLDPDAIDEIAREVGQ
ncbi:MAG: formate dehydrogenase subunit gamma [Alphaproteobacteria bacterium]|nr:formate dehydrogenase subunit gamma [Alphaproteobacteria bacterium]